MNLMSRIAIFAVLGAILSSAVLVGCGGNNADDTTNAPANKAAGATNDGTG